MEYVGEGVVRLDFIGDLGEANRTDFGDFVCGCCWPGLGIEFRCGSKVGDVAFGSRVRCFDAEGDARALLWLLVTVALLAEGEGDGETVGLGVESKGDRR